MNIYLQLIIDKANKKSKYLKWYVDICNIAIKRIDQTQTFKIQHFKAKELLGYTENHHILPRSFCESKLQEQNRLNRIRLTAREHFIAHLLLAKIFGGDMWYAANTMTTGFGASKDQREIYTAGSRFYKIIKDNIATETSIRFKGRINSDSHNKKISESHMGNPKSKDAVSKGVETRKRNGSYVPWNKGKTGVQESWNKGLTKETDERLIEIGKSISSAKVGKPSKNKGKKLDTPAWNKGYKNGVPPTQQCIPQT